MSRYNIKQLEKLDKEAEIITSIPVIQDREYQKLSYIYDTNKYGGNRILQKREHYFKSTRRKL